MLGSRRYISPGMDTASGPTRGVKLPDYIADDLRSRLEAGEWSLNDKLPSESELTDHYGVSRATIRTALHALDRQGLIVTVHGVGTFASAAAQAAGQVVAADLQRLESISQTIERMGRVPSSRFRSISMRQASTVESEALVADPDTQVLAVQREILADGDVVAYSHDAIPAAVLGPDFDMRSVDGSLFAFLGLHGIDVRSSRANIHASLGDDIVWADTDDAQLYLLLEQAHFDARHRGVAYSRTWFLQGRFQFSIVRLP